MFAGRNHLLAVAVLLLSGVAGARPLEAARQRYDAEIARCNTGTLSAPARDSCVRSAGLALDRARGGPPVDVLKETTNGRAVVETPVNAPRPATDSTTRTSSDGRATIVLPAGRSTSR
jgi:hypothetical protein